jgi:hypothetical protein
MIFTFIYTPTQMYITSKRSLENHLIIFEIFEMKKNVSKIIRESVPKIVNLQMLSKNLA